MLQNLMRKMKKGNKGFTLVELMIVVVIIGILIAIAIPIYRNIQSSAETRACQANLRSLKSQLEVYRADHSTSGGSGTYPLTANYAAFITYAFEAEPICPVGTASYTYASDGATYTLDCPNVGTYTDHHL